MNSDNQLLLLPKQSYELVLKADFFTPDQIAVFYSGINDILLEHNIVDVEIKIEEGSLKTMLITVANIGVILIKSMLNPSTPNEVRVASKITDSFNNNRFIALNIENKTVYNQENIVQKNEEFKNKLKELERNNTTETQIETLQMIISSEKITSTIENSKGEIKEKHIFKFTALFNDIRFYNINYAIKIITEDGVFKNIDHQNAHKYYFIAYGILHKQDNKYIKFEITNLIQNPTIIQEINRSSQF